MLLSNLLKNDRGSISVLITSISFVTLIIISFVGILISGFTMANRLNNVAERVALGAATQLISNPENACNVAANLAVSNEVELQLCEINDDEVLIRVRSSQQIQSWLDRWKQIGMARAGIDYVFD